MATIGSVVAGVAHEVRNPLFAMSVNIDVLAAELGEAPEVRELIEALRVERDRISRLMQDLLDFGRPLSGVRRECQLERILERAIAQVRPVALARGVSIQAEGAARASLLADASERVRLLADQPTRQAALLVKASGYLADSGDSSRALANLYRATELDPLSSSAWSALSALSLAARRLDLARSAAGRSLRLLPEQDTAPTYLASVELLLGRPQAAIAAAAHCPEPLFRHQVAAAALHDMGRHAEARAELAALEAEHAQDAAFQIAAVHAWWGDADRAFQWLERAVDQNDGGLVALRMEPLLTRIQGDARFGALVARVGLQPGPQPR